MGWKGCTQSKISVSAGMLRSRLVLSAARLPPLPLPRRSPLPPPPPRPPLPRRTRRRSPRQPVDERKTTLSAILSRKENTFQNLDCKLFELRKTKSITLLFSIIEPRTDPLKLLRSYYVGTELS